MLPSGPLGSAPSQETQSYLGPQPGPSRAPQRPHTKGPPFPLPGPLPAATPGAGTQAGSLDPAKRAGGRGESKISKNHFPGYEKERDAPPPSGLPAMCVSFWHEAYSIIKPSSVGSFSELADFVFNCISPARVCSAFLLWFPRDTKACCGGENRGGLGKRKGKSPWGALVDASAPAFVPPVP